MILDRNRLVITYLSFCLLFLQSNLTAKAQSKALVFQSDFSLKDGAVSAMKGVAYGISSSLDIFDITHEIPPYNIWEASYRLHQTVTYWPKGTVFVSIVDPGVGSERKSVVLKTKSGHFIVTPDNGTLTLVAETLGIEAVREIDEVKNRRKGSEQSYTFHGRDVYAFTGAKLAAGVITFEGVGPLLPPKVEMINYQKAMYDNGTISGNIPIIDIQYGNVWTNIDKVTFDRLGVRAGDMLMITIQDNGKTVFSGTMPFATTFSAVNVGENLGYLNSLLNFSISINQQNFSEKYKVFSGPSWSITIKKK